MARSPNGSIVTFRRDGEVVGVGFLIDRTHILTCAHVLNVVLGRDPHAQQKPDEDDEIDVEFSLVDHHPTRRARVVRWVPPAARDTSVTRACDIAALQLLSTENPPRGSAGLKPGRPRAHASVEAYGYPSEPRRNNGGWVTGHLLREVDNGLVQIDSDLTAALRAQPGYSGSPVIDTKTGRAVGIITAASIRDHQRDSYAVTSTRLHALWPDVVRVTRMVTPPPVPPPVLRRAGMAAFFVVVLVLAAWILWPSGGSTAAADCVPLEVNVSTEKDDLLTELAEKYNNSDHDGACGMVHVTALVSGEAKDAIAEGRAQPRPQVWLPSSSMWTRLLEQTGHTGHEELSPITTSVLSIAMPQSSADTARGPDGELSWKDLRDLARGGQGPFKLGRDNPNFSTSGLAASVAIYHAAAEKTDGLTEADLDHPAVVPFVRDIETAVPWYGDDATKVMETLYELDRGESPGTEPVSAIMVQEQLVHLYNQGLLGDGDKPNERMVAIQPEEGTVRFDHPFVLLSVTGEQRAAAVDFHEFLVAGEQQQRFIDLGFRDLDRPAQATGELAGSVEAREDVTQTFFELPGPELMKKVQAAWTKIRRPARVLLVLDVSSSMNEPADSRRPESKLELLRDAAKEGLGLLGDNDEVGIWTFADTVSRPLGMTSVRTVRPQLNAIIDNLRTANNTALHEAITRAHQSMLDTIDHDKINAIVVLSDGEQHPADPAGREDLLREFQNQETPVRVFTVPYGAGADTAGNRQLLKDISLLSGAVTYDATNAGDIGQIMVSVFSNFG